MIHKLLEGKKAREVISEVDKVKKYKLIIGDNAHGRFDIIDQAKKAAQEYELQHPSDMKEKMITDEDFDAGYEGGFVYEFRKVSKKEVGKYTPWKQWNAEYDNKMWEG